MTREAMIQDLRRSGLSQRDATALGCKALSEKQTKKLVNISAKAYQLPYYDVRGKQNGFWRVRFLEEVKDRKRPGKLVRYSQPANAPPQFYLSPMVDWSEIRKTTSLPIWFTEGEKKAAKACKSGLPCIGLGGVWNWRSKKEHLTLIPAFHEFDWEEREVTLCFDSDYSQNPNVNAAMHALARELFQMGAEVTFKQLPQSDEDQKVGLDDYLLDYTLQDLLSLPEEPFMEGMRLLDLNQELAIIQESASILHLPTRVLYASPQPLVKVLYANRTMPKVLESGKVKEVNIAEEWLRSKFRREHLGITYQPGCEQEATEDNFYNLWLGWGVSPKKGSVKPFLSLVDHLFKDTAPAVKQWFLQWLAYPLQHPGTKLYSSVILVSKEQGTGKTVLGYTMGRIYGQNYQEVDKKALTKSFNQWAERKQFILGDEITGSDKRSEADSLKSLITRDQVTVNAKYQKEYVIPDCINYLLASNHVDALFLEDHDRRFCVIDCKQQPMSRKWYRDYDQWYKDEGPSYVFNYLLGLDLKGFDPLGHAPDTEAKDEMVFVNKLDIDHWAQLVVDDPDEALMGSQSELWTVQELRELVRRFLDEKGFIVSVRQITMALAKVSIQGKRVRLAGGTLKKLYALRRLQHWERCWDEPKLWVQQYEKEREQLARQENQRY